MMSFHDKNDFFSVFQYFCNFEIFEKIRLQFSKNTNVCLKYKYTIFKLYFLFLIFKNLLFIEFLKRGPDPEIPGNPGANPDRKLFDLNIQKCMF